MGEAHPESIARIKELTGHKPRHGTTPDGRQCLHIGDLMIVATEFALWSDPSVWEYSDDIIAVSWGGNTVRMQRDHDGAWTANIIPDPLRGKARFVI
ncbi:hypothetical protein NSE01_30170 [Novosphingobium sediminis]|uniref:Uncharacterized protein n=1 Tax=Novosphingobium sediminis TaxID=707214 RepID=A0A512AN90_9SPHN|nr:hypothetical protein [Novosphingobium sediminis]GEO01185.1 hypothetical protein NSE01_30170 [Novosphingobium sediminis]